MLEKNAGAFFEGVYRGVIKRESLIRCRWTSTDKPIIN
jgi:hypothetical protein